MINHLSPAPALRLPTLFWYDAAIAILIQFRNFLSRKERNAKKRKARQKPISLRPLRETLRPLREIHFFYFQIGLLYRGYFAWTELRISQISKTP